MKDGGVATKLKRLGMNLTRVGTCDGTVVISKTGNPYCKTKTVILHSTIPGSRDGIVDVIHSGCEVQKKEIEYLKQMRTRNAANIKDASRRIARLTEQLDSTLKTIEQLTGKKQDRGRAPRERTRSPVSGTRTPSSARPAPTPPPKPVQRERTRSPVRRTRAPPPARQAPTPMATELARIQKRARNESPAGTALQPGKKQTESKRTRR